MYWLVDFKGIYLALEPQTCNKNVILVVLLSRLLNHRLEIQWFRQCYKYITKMG